MEEYKIRTAKIKDASYMAKILREIGWSERRNALFLEEVSKPIEGLIKDTLENPEINSIFVAADISDNVVGFLNVHWVPFVMLGSYEGYVSDVFVSPNHSGEGIGSLLVKAVMKEGEKRDVYRLMLTNGKEKPSYKRGFYKKLGWTERPKVANFVYYYKEPWS
ncbi:MAG: GNAT family N-acetyltransferase [Candidatus Dadabacteria bacterium]|nr:GNAT family N-acetyltransferase [Candidatus Dadabacteria bacterium]NIQ13826.1 GNAT family N-acetyltransferase [Candidatus Dadabacteria bacterium]